MNFAPVLQHISHPHGSALRRRAAALLAMTGLSLSAQAQTCCLKPPPPMVVYPKYYEARDLGAVATSVSSFGCIARNGAVALTRKMLDTRDFPDDFIVNNRAVLPLNPDYPLTYTHNRDTEVTGCNSRDEYVGTSYSEREGGMVWDKDWRSAPAQVLPPTSMGPAQPLAINDSRQVVGLQTLEMGGQTYASATLWTTSQIPYDTRVIARELFRGWAVAINNSGQVAGNSGQSARAMLHDTRTGSTTSLMPPNAWASRANGLDEQGRLVGGYVDKDGRQAGFIWDNGVYTLLKPGKLAGRTLMHTVANAIGADRLVVGQSFDLVGGSPRDPQATVWAQAGAARNLNNEVSLAGGATLGLNLTDAIGVADNGTVLAEGRVLSSGERRAVLLVPRPGGRWSSLALFP